MRFGRCGTVRETDFPPISIFARPIDAQSLHIPETTIRLCAERAHGMSSSDEPRRVHFQSPEYLVERLDAIADLFETDRTDLLVDAIREYIDETAHSESFQELVATKYYDEQLDFEAVKQLVGAEAAQRLRLLKANLDGEPFDLASPDDTDIYDGEATEVAGEQTGDEPGTR